MPELPEVEVTKRGISSVLLNHTIENVFVGEKKLRVPLSPDLKKLVGAYVSKIERRGKYIVVFTSNGSLVVHLGMTGHLQIIESSKPRATHDHFELMLDSKMSVRYNDTRRFGLVVYLPLEQDPYLYKPLAELGPEPLEDSFTGQVLFERIAKRTCSLKQALMDHKLVVGVGNIYANECLFLSHLDPRRKANSLTLDEANLLVSNIKDVLTKSIASGGTTIRDFEGADGKPGYFVQNLKIYGRAGENCPVCGTKIELVVLGQRSTFFCPHCQH